MPIRDLWTGSIIKRVTLGSPDITLGDYIFHLCLGEVLSSKSAKLSEASLVIVPELGKGRAVTKGHVCLKIVLDFINKICSVPIEKIQSSKSGMAKANHGWNFFKFLHSEEAKDLVFHERKKPVKIKLSNGEETVTRSYTPIYNSSTDFKTATDNLLHIYGEEIGMALMTQCGIPPILKQIVRKTCYSPRKIYFKPERV